MISKFKNKHIRPVQVFVIALLLVYSHVLFSAEKLNEDDYKEIEWTDLMPPMDKNALERASLNSFLFEDTGEFMAHNKTQSSVVPELDGQAVKLPGFIVPLEFNDEQVITQFFIVPYFGACIHEPPPPPNQIVFVDYPEGIQIYDIYVPYWFNGKLLTTTIENEMAASSYTLNLHFSEEYDGW